MFCSKCGGQVGEDANFCSLCGAENVPGTDPTPVYRQSLILNPVPEVSVYIPPKSETPPAPENIPLPTDIAIKTDASVVTTPMTDTTTTPIMNTTVSPETDIKSTVDSPSMNDVSPPADVLFIKEAFSTNENTQEEVTPAVNTSPEGEQSDFVKVPASSVDFLFQEDVTPVESVTEHPQTASFAVQGVNIPPVKNLQYASGLTSSLDIPSSAPAPLPLNSLPVIDMPNNYRSLAHNEQKGFFGKAAFAFCLTVIGLLSIACGVLAALYFGGF